jgi:hypothetical protein
MAEYVSELTRKTLQQFGWADGDPIPENMGDLLAQIHERTPASKVPGLYVDVSAMPPADIELIKTALAAAKVKVERDRKQAEYSAKTAGMSPEMISLYNKVTPTQEETGPQIIDDRQTNPPIAPPPPPPPAQEAPPSAEPVVEAPDVQLNAAPAVEVFCPRCNWDMRQKYEVAATEADKELFVAAVLGGKRFLKNYTLMGGRYEVKFRSLLAEENKQIHRRMLLDQKRDEFQSDTEWFLRFFEYRLACSVEAVIADNKVIATVPELDEVSALELPNKTDDKELDPLVRLRNYVVADILKTEITRRLVSNQFREFQRLYESLEAMALEPSFW